jgi:VanZ family protein
MAKLFHYRRVGIVLSVLALVILTVLLLLPSDKTPQTGTVSDKVLHAVGYFGLCLPVLLVWPAIWRWVLALAALHGGMIEIIQPSVGRSAEFADFLANLFGAGLAVLVALWLNRSGQAQQRKGAKADN